MKTNIITACLTLLLAANVAAAQAPKVRTSAPPEKTAQLKGAKTERKEVTKTATEKNTQPKEKASKKSEPKKGRKKPQPKAGPIPSATPSGRFMAVKTNLAYDAFAVLNACFEIEVSDHISLDLPVIWSLWDWKRDLGLRTAAFQPEARYWPGKVGQGSAFGVSLGIATYNFRHDGIRYQDTGRPMLSASLAYTYSLDIDSRWSAEFSLAIGYANTKYNRYYNIDNGALINTKTRDYFGPTKVGVSLSYRLGK